MKKIVYNDLQQNLIEFPVKSDVISIGRKPDNDIVLTDIFVSRNHCEIYYDNDDYYILDKKSKFGVIVNGKKVDKAKLTSGDEIKLGNTILYFLDEKDSLSKKKRNDKMASFDPLNELEIMVSSYDEEDDRFSDIREILGKIKVKEIEIGRRLKNYELMYKVGTMINSIFNMDVLLKIIMSLALDVVNGDFGFIFIIDQDGSYKYVTKNINSPDELVLKDHIKRLEKEKKTFILKDGDIKKLNLKNVNSLIVNPLLSKNQDLLGAIYIGKNELSNAFNSETIEFLEIFSSYVGISIDNSLLFQKIKKEEDIKNNLKRYLSDQVVETISEETTLQLGGKEEDISVMFIDIRSFTPLSSNLEAQQVVEILNSFFTFVSEYIFKYNGTLDKFIGDCVMVIFGAPIQSSKHADEAVQCALDIKKAYLKEFKKSIKKRFKIDMDIGIGINSGIAIVGNIGTPKRMDFTAISDTVNVAERIESVSKNSQVLISPWTKEKLKGKYKIEEVGEKQLKGKAKPIMVYEVK